MTAVADCVQNRACDRATASVLALLTLKETMLANLGSSLHLIELSPEELLKPASDPNQLILGELAAIFAPKC